MKNKEEQNILLDYFQSIQHNELLYDEKSIHLAYENSNEKQSFAIKILSIFGGILGSCSFIGFLLVAGLYDSNISMVITGLICIIASIFINKGFNNIIVDTLSISFYGIGYILLAFGMYKFEYSTAWISSTFILIALVTLFFVQNYIITFITTLLIHGSIIAILFSNNLYDFFHIYVAMLCFTVTYLFMNEPKFLTGDSKLATIYYPARIALVFCLLSGFIFLEREALGSVYIYPNYIWPTSIVTISAIIYIIYSVLNIIKISKPLSKVIVYTVTAIILLPTVPSPAISGSLLIVLLSFYVNYKTSFAIGIVAFMYFFGQYYYDLNLTLLTKSILLFASGVLFFLFYLYTHKKLNSNEKI